MIQFFIPIDCLPLREEDPPTYILKVINLINSDKLNVKRRFLNDDSEDGLYLRFIDEELNTIKFVLKDKGSELSGTMNIFDGRSLKECKTEIVS